MPLPHAFGPKQSKSTGLFPPPPDPHHSPYARSAQHPDHVKPSHFFGWKFCSCNIFLGSFGCFFYLNQRWSSRIWARSRHEHHNNIFFQGSKRHIPPLNKKLAGEDVTQGVWKLWKESLRETINPPAFLIHFHRLGTKKLIKTTLPLAAFLLKRGNTTYLNQMYYLWNVYNLIGEM